MMGRGRGRPEVHSVGVGFGLSRTQLPLVGEVSTVVQPPGASVPLVFKAAE